jgi:dTDP-4-amino-4,6-dideoxygalactose transaminase
MTEIEAAIGLVQLKKVDGFNEKRIRNSEDIINEMRTLSWAEIPVMMNNDVKHTYFWCPVMVKPESGKSIEDLKAHLHKNRIGFRHRYDTPLYRQPVLKKLGLNYDNLNLPNAEGVAGSIVGLPNHPLLGEAEIARIIEVLKKF